TVQADGKILVVTNQPQVLRLNADGSVDASFNAAIPANAGETARSFPALALQSDGRIIVGGGGSAGAAGTPLPLLVRLNTNGSIDASFSPAANGNVTAVALQPDGRLMVGGKFTTIGGEQRVALARLNVGPAAQSLAASADRRTITWVRSGAAGELAAVTFEISTDRATWS